MSDLTEAEEEYLEALYRLKGSSEKVKVGDLADELEIKEPSVVEMLEKLEEKNLLEYERYQGAELTEKGEEEGIRVTRCHRLAERLLCDVLNRDLPEVHEEACELEHSLADETADEIANVLENPETCPHGNPIPEEIGEIDEEAMKLTEGKEGEEYEVLTIPEGEEDVKRLLPMAVLPGCDIKLAEKPSFSAIMVEHNGDKLALSRDIASKIKVKPCGGKRRRRRRGRSGR